MSGVNRSLSLALVAILGFSFGCSALTAPNRDDVRSDPVAIAKAAASVVAPGGENKVLKVAEGSPNGPVPNVLPNPAIAAGARPQGG